MYLWENNVIMPEFPRLKGDTETEVLVIGGGIAGLLCAYMLRERGVERRQENLQWNHQRDYCCHNGAAWEHIYKTDKEIRKREGEGLS